MALKRLTTGEMVSLSASWVESDHVDRKALAAIPVIASLLPRVDLAHATLLETQTACVAPERLAAIQDEQKRVDARHDDLARGAYYLPMALAYLVKNKHLAQSLLELQSVLLPDGLTIVQKSYREEAGQTALLDSRLSPDHIALLKKIKTPEGNLWDAIQEWMNVGAKLGALENERTAPEPAGTSASDVVKARNQWIRTVNAMRSVLALVDDHNPLVQSILRRIDEAELKADRRIASSDAAHETTSQPDTNASG